MLYLDFLRELHAVLQPPAYLEIGVDHGASLALAGGPAIGVDPAPRVAAPLGAGAVIYAETSDAFFARAAPLAHFGGRAPALALIDGMHLAEFALRDFVNTERLMDPRGVIVFDDIYPRERAWANREHPGHFWTGDVYKLVALLARERPDLTLLQIDTDPGGLLLVLGLDPASTALAERYDALAAEIDQPDPQAVPSAVLKRRGALDPRAVLAGGVWSALAAGGDVRAAAAGLGGRRRLRRPRARAAR
jgi:Methyltransferase domain